MFRDIKVISQNDIEPSMRTSVAFRRADGMFVIGGEQPITKKDSAISQFNSSEPTISMFIGVNGTYRIGRRSRVIKETRTRPADREAYAPFKATPSRMEGFASWNRIVAATIAAK